MSARNQSGWPKRGLGTRKFLQNYRKLMLLKMDEAQRWWDEAASALGEARRTHRDAPPMDSNCFLQNASVHYMEACSNLSEQRDKLDALNKLGLMWFDPEVEGLWIH